MSSTERPINLVEAPATWSREAVHDHGSQHWRLEAVGPEALSDAEALAVMADLSLERAQRLIVEFGSLPEVLGAPAAELTRVAAAAAGKIVLVRDLARRLLEAPLKQRPVISSWTALLAYVRTVLTGAPREEFGVLFLDRKKQLIANELVGRGTVDHAPVYPREVVRRALERNASAMILLHIRSASAFSAA